MFVSEEVEPGISRDIVKVIAETIGIANLSSEAAQELAEDATFKLSVVVQEAKKFRDRACRRKLSTDDFDRSLKLRNIEPVYGFGTPDFVPFRYAGGGGRDVYFTEDKEVDLAQFINSGIPKAPLEVTLKAHWLAVDGVQPAVPENPIVTDKPPEEDSETTDNKKKPPRRTGAEMVTVKSVVSHDISVEQQLFYKEITEACVGADEARRSQALHSLGNDTGIQPLLPRLALFIAEGIRCNVVQRNLALLIYLTRMIAKLIENAAVNLEKYLHELLPATLTCILSRYLAKSDTENHFALRDFSAKLLGELCKAYSGSVSNLLTRIVSVLSQGLNQNTLEATYGALTAFYHIGVAEVLMCDYEYDQTVPTHPLSPKSTAERVKEMAVKVLCGYVKSDSSVEAHYGADPDAMRQDFGEPFARLVADALRGMTTTSSTPTLGTPVTTPQLRAAAYGSQFNFARPALPSNVAMRPTGVSGIGANTTPGQRLVLLRPDGSRPSGPLARTLSMSSYSSGQMSPNPVERVSTPLSAVTTPTGKVILLHNTVRTSRSNSPGSTQASSPASVKDEPPL